MTDSVQLGLSPFFDGSTVMKFYPHIQPIHLVGIHNTELLISIRAKAGTVSAYFWTHDNTSCMIYRIAGKFCGGLIFVNFMTALTVTKFTPHENLPVRKGRLVKVAASVYAIVVKHKASASIC